MLGSDPRRLVTGSWSKRLMLLVVFATAAVLLSGCLYRTSGPTLPYVKAADSVPNPDQARVHLAARMESMETEMQQLRQMIELLQASGGDSRAIGDLEIRVAFIERQLGIEPPQIPPSQAGIPRAPAPVPGVRRPPSPVPGSPTVPPGPSVGSVPPASPVGIRSSGLPEDERAYRDAYSLFRNGSMDEAIDLFQAFLLEHPKSKLAGNAVYWFAEALFAKERYDEAVLQYDRVIKEYPASNKKVGALLKQGQAFEKMGDGRSAGIIYEKLIKENPHTAQARIARSRLKPLRTDLPSER
jgi:tol-pal system protein YbgF